MSTCDSCSKEKTPLYLNPKKSFRCEYWECEECTEYLSK